ncbi:MAG: LysR family transcriptional regulator [Cocleimonas sp.]
MRKNITPRLDRIPLKHFRTYTAYIRTGSVVAAANSLHVSPSAVSQQLSLLEDNVGTPLVIKTLNGIKPSDIGQEILLAAARIENVLQTCQISMEKLGDRNSGRVSLGIFSSANYFAPYLIAEFKKSHPNVDVRIRIGNRDSIFKAFRNYEFDFLVVGRPPKEMDMDSVEIGEHPHIIIGSPEHPMINQKNLSLKDFDNETFLIREEGSGTRMVMVKLFEDAGISPNSTMEVGNNESIKQAVIAGLGVAFISAHTVADELKDGRLKKFDIKGFPVIRKWLVVTHKNIELVPAAESLLNFFIESGVDYLPKYRA